MMLPLAAVGHGQRADAGVFPVLAVDAHRVHSFRAGQVFLDLAADHRAVSRRDHVCRVRYFPAMNQQAPSFLRKWTRGKDLARLETAAEQIGNPHQFIQWGDALRDVGRWQEAGERL